MSMSISQFYILSQRGDTIITRDFRGDVPKGTAEIFFRKATLWRQGEDTPPIFHSAGVNYLFVKKNGLFFVCTSQTNSNATLIIELLNKIAKVFKDYCGVLTEESIRKNFVLLYELLDEMVDFGYPQSTSTESLKLCVHNEAQIVESTSPQKLLNLNPRTVPSNAVHRPVGAVAGGNKKNEIFVDILERITVLLNANGIILNSSIEGSIQMKSYLSGNPELKLAINEDLVIGSSSGLGAVGSASVILDDCNFHECADLSEFEDQRILSLNPPDGEFAVMNYRITSDFRVPFRIFPFLEETNPYKLELTIKARADMPEQNYGGNVQFSVAMPKTTSSVSCDIAPNSGGNSSAEFLQSESKLVWVVKKFTGGSEIVLKARINLSQALKPDQNKASMLGPINVSFEIPMYNTSKMQVRYLRIRERHKSYNPYRWVRYVTQSNSYVCRLT